MPSEQSQTRQDSPVRHYPTTPRQTNAPVEPVMIAVSRMEGEHTLEGDPVYNMKSTLVTDVRAPQELKKSA